MPLAQTGGMFSITKYIFEKTREAESEFMNHPNPTVLSCGGIYIPRRKIPDKITYQVLNLPNEQEPIKIYVGRRGAVNKLQEVLAKEILN